MNIVQTAQKTEPRKRHATDTATATPPRARALVIAARGMESIPFHFRQSLGNFADADYLANLEPLDSRTFITLARSFEYLAVTRRAIEKIDSGIIESLPQLKGISVYSTGLEWIDQECLRKRNIRLLGLPDYCSNAVAETALGLVLMAAHRLHLRYMKSIAAIPGSVSLRGFELQHRSVGIIGFGRIGRLLAQKVQPLCKKVLAFDTNEKQFEYPHGVMRTGVEPILANCDFVVFCASQEYEPGQIIAPDQYALLRPETVIVNAGRTSLLHHELLVKMVKRRQIGAYIYDDLMRDSDWPNEKDYGRIIPTGHTAWYTDEAISRGTESWINNLITLCKTT